MLLNGMLFGTRLLDYVGCPTPEVLGPAAMEDEIRGLIDRHGSNFVKPFFRGGVRSLRHCRRPRCGTTAAPEAWRGTTWNGPRPPFSCMAA